MSFTNILNFIETDNYVHLFLILMSEIVIYFEQAIIISAMDHTYLPIDDRVKRNREDFSNERVIQ